MTDVIINLVSGVLVAIITGGFMWFATHQVGISLLKENYKNNKEMDDERFRLLKADLEKNAVNLEQIKNDKTAFYEEIISRISILETKIDLSINKKNNG